MFNKKKETSSDEPIQQKALRLWPGVTIVIVQWLLWLVLPIIIPEATMIAVLGGLLGGVAILVWWAFFSRAARFERWFAIVLAVLALVATSTIIHESIATSMQGLMFVMYAFPVLSLAFVIWAVVTRHLSGRIRLISMAASILLACGLWVLLRTNGMTGDIRHDFAWRWSKTSEERLLAQDNDEQMLAPSNTHAKDTSAYWPGFRGANRDGIIRGLQIKTDWSATPPLELWRRPIGPGCSSFAIRGNLLYTQEQRGEDEVVACYDLTTGEPVWRHRDAARFWDSHAGAGPRSTPTLHEDRVYSFGATGILNAIDARDGTLVWSRNAASDTGAKDSGWGFSSSPLVVDDVVIVATVGQLAAYDLATGDPRWYGPDGGDSYSSPHLATIDGVDQVLLMSGAGAISMAPADGQLLWEHPWPNETRIVQPAMLDDGDILMSAGSRKGMGLFTIMQVADEWILEEHWTTTRLKPDFNDFVVHKNHVFGFDGPSIVCIDVETGKRKWKGGRYGGQLLLLVDQDLLLVLSEKGELALVEATPGGFTELTLIPAIEGKTWNHPALVNDLLLVRNTEEMVAFQLPLAED